MPHHLNEQGWNPLVTPPRESRDLTDQEWTELLDREERLHAMHAMRAARG
ncbi:uncharacterized protein BDR25DRAFT_358408 [Lindgomyces ingoldianus]|uniref:Uncharacterized protein n=1 Tax=Lindgomyces ingoldianus TaxID=673940 RepID=A0ACB6QNP3_9PLEO|nr:uncharacterized protein BDR25DRAFT_358408 [Lindgomyces ingoldianus]KAF2467722.1 hypothetical protein BDR25DRAFT_358408 [Lindgomyces ingoldianus]